MKRKSGERISETSGGNFPFFPFIFSFFYILFTLLFNKDFGCESFIQNKTKDFIFNYYVRIKKETEPHILKILFLVLKIEEREKDSCFGTLFYSMYAITKKRPNNLPIID